MAKKKVEQVAEEQPMLVDLGTAPAELLDLPLEQLPPNHALESPEPSRQFVADYKLRGQIMPIIVIRQPNGILWPRDGRNRIKTARLLGKPTIRALVYSNVGTLEALTITTAANAHRRCNPIADLHVLTQLESEHKPLALSGIPSATIRKLTRLATLEPEFIAAIEAGKLSVGAAEGIAKLEKRQRKALRDLAKQGKKISATDVSEAKRVQASGAAAEYADVLNAPMEAEAIHYVVAHCQNGQIVDHALSIDECRQLAGQHGQGFRAYRLVEV